MKKFWLDFGDVDGHIEFFHQEEWPQTWGACYGPFDTLKEAKVEARAICSHIIAEWKGIKKSISKRKAIKESQHEKKRL